MFSAVQSGSSKVHTLDLLILDFIVIVYLGNFNAKNVTKIKFTTRCGA
jgi:hypothetical protein